MDFSKHLNDLDQDRIITFLVPDKITTDGFFHKNTDMFKWAKNSREAKNDIIHDTTKHLHFENIKIYESIPLNVRFKDREDNGNGDNSKNSNASSCKSILNILTAEEMETPLIKDHLKLLKRWRTEDSDANFFGGQANIAKSLTKKLQKNQIANIKQIRWSERLNALKKCYI